MVIPRMLPLFPMYDNLYGWIVNYFCDCCKVSGHLRNNNFPHDKKTFTLIQTIYPSLSQVILT